LSSKKTKGTHNNENQLIGLRSFEPTKKQKTVNNLLIEFPLVFIEGCSGTGKTSGILYHYCNQYLEDKTRNIVIIRTPVEAGPDKIGFLPGEQDEKLGPHFKSAEVQLKEFLGGKYGCDLNKRIHYMVPNYALGCTLNNSLILIDEAQQLTTLILKMLLERIGTNSVCAVVGDPTQLYASGREQRNGLTSAQERFFTKREYGGNVGWEPRSNLVARFEYEYTDNVRSDISQEVVRLYSER